MPIVSFAALDSRVRENLLSGMEFSSDAERDECRALLEEGNWRYRTVTTELSSFEFPEDLRPEWTIVVWSCDAECTSFYAFTPSGKVYVDADLSFPRFLAEFADYVEREDGVFLEDWSLTSPEFRPRYSSLSAE